MAATVSYRNRAGLQTPSYPRKLTKFRFLYCTVLQSCLKVFYSSKNLIHIYFTKYNVIQTLGMKTSDFTKFRLFICGLFNDADSAVGIATGYGLGDRGVGVRVPVEPRVFSSPRRPDRLWGLPPIQWVSGALFWR
jgi:hypothetical protein